MSIRPGIVRRFHLPFLGTAGPFENGDGLRRAVICLTLPLLLGACSTTGGDKAAGSGSTGVPRTALVTEGPSLALVGEYDGMRLEGYMDRTCMTGYGSLGLRAVGQYRRGDVAVDVPPLPGTAVETEAGPSGSRHGLALSSYPAQKSQKSGQAGTKLRPSPAESAARAKRGKGLRLASYPQDDPPPAPDGRLPEEKADDLVPAAPPLRTQASNAAEYESSVPVAVEFVCEASVDTPPTNKARIRGVFQCTGGRQILFSLRNLGPDQGVGIGKETEAGNLMVLFYHSSMDEARRRFPSVRQDIVLARQQNE